MAVTDLSPEQEADRLIGKSIEASSRGDVLRVADTMTDALNLLTFDDHGDVIELLNAARTVDPSSRQFRDYCEDAKDTLGAGE